MVSVEHDHLRDARTPLSTVLFLAANPARVPLLQLGEECRAIEEKIRLARFRDRLRFHSWWAARPGDLLDALNEHNPSVLHFSGHGAGDQGLCFQSPDGGVSSVSADSLSMVLRAAGAGVLIVFLNACYSEIQAHALAAHIPCVVGMPDAIGDDAAILYAGSFYSALASGRSVANAHKQGIASLQVSMPHGPHRDAIFTGDVQRSTAPRLLSRPDVDAEHVYLVGRAKNQTSCTIIIEAKLPECDANVLARITEELRMWTGDFSLRIVNAEHGSVRLTVILSVDASQRLMAARTGGHLTQLAGFPVRDIVASPRSHDVTWSDAAEAGDADDTLAPTTVAFTMRPGELHTRLTSAICELVYTLAPKEADYIELIGEDLTTALIAGEDVRRTFRRRAIEGDFRAAREAAHETLESLSLAWHTYKIFSIARNYLRPFVSLPPSVQESIMRALRSEGLTTEAASRIAITVIKILNKSFTE